MGRVLTGIVLIVLGLSGNFALRGTNSPTALVVIGFIVLIVGIIQMVSRADDNGSNDEDVRVIPNPEKRLSNTSLQETTKKEIPLPVEVDEETKMSIQQMNKSDAIGFLRSKYNISIKEARLIIQATQ